MVWVGISRPAKMCLSAAQRELVEETGLTGVALTLRGVININTRGR